MNYSLFGQIILTDLKSITFKAFASSGKYSGKHTENKVKTRTNVEMDHLPRVIRTKMCRTFCISEMRLTVRTSIYQHSGVANRISCGVTSSINAHSEIGKID